MTRSGGTREGFKEEVVALDLVSHHWATSYLSLWDCHVTDGQMSTDSVRGYLRLGSSQCRAWDARIYVRSDPREDT